jgi:NAD(P)-dependent dehydrogenase (short-subunit alcohol dehydrogenase family)
MIEQGSGGRIVHVGSRGAFRGEPDHPAYGATKAAVLQMTECLRLDLDRYGIGVSAICPGAVDTPITGSTRLVGLPPGVDGELRERMVRAIERRGFPPEKVARAILRAVRRDTPVALVAAEARFGRALSRVSPTANRAIGGIGRRAGDHVKDRMTS